MIISYDVTKATILKNEFEKYYQSSLTQHFNIKLLIRTEKKKKLNALNNMNQFYV